MPMYSYRCVQCGEEFEALVSSGESPSCPACGQDGPERLVAAPAIGGKTKAGLARARQQAAKEGHFSNYSRSDLKGKL